MDKKQKMIVMPANSTGWFWHCLARETGCIGHLFSPKAQTGPYPWFPYACDNGAFSCWDSKLNTFDLSKWEHIEQDWHNLLFWCQAAPIKPMWCIVPDVVGNAVETIKKYQTHRKYITDCGFKVALAVQDGMNPIDVLSLEHQPDIICVGGSTQFKWDTVEQWVRSFKRVHVLRCNSPEKLPYLDSLGVESCDGTGWNRGNRTQTKGLEEWARVGSAPRTDPLWNYTCRQAKDKKQITLI